MLYSFFVKTKAVLLAHVFDMSTAANISIVVERRDDKKFRSVLSLFYKLLKGVSAPENLAIAHFDYPTFYIFSEEHIYSMLQHADAFVKNDYTPELS